ncbi:MAG: hypothetical protein L0H74_02440 [Brachybacterium sp.]|nr:hypothetical protein [Brachybacterium sp.]
MNTFWGCETERLTELSTVFDTRAVQLRALILQARLGVHAVDWIGPDAEEHRRCAEDLVETVITLIERLRKLAELLGREAAEQNLCSRAEEGPARAGDPLGVRATPPWVPDPGERLPSLSGPSVEDLLPRLGGPLMAEDPSRIAELLPDLPDLRDIGPLIGGPLMAEPPLRPHPASRPLPEGEDFALDPEILAEAEHQRNLVLGGIPGVGLAQTMMSAHEAVGGFYDRVELTLEESGYGAFTPVVSLARIPHDASDVVLGENSVLGQTLSGIDRGVANAIQTGGEVFTAVGDGDLAGAVRATERGSYRHAGSVADILTATPVPAVAETTSDLIGTSAELTEPISPEAAQTLRTAEQSVRDLGHGWEQGQERLTDPEFYYDLRRTYFPTGWDPQA